ncbi:transposase [Tateyamaria pelophila]|uniref:transposase n=1 Tax=Tateyamaria pelophila TaxID=328415 RepID=UPI001CBD543C|nr:transposase [Tateyamaria pelophila]
MARQDTACELMMTIPGVGAIGALTVRSAIDDSSRFRSSQDVGPWVGLTPRREQSGERDITDHITRADDEALRTSTSSRRPHRRSRNCARRRPRSRKSLPT